MRRTIAEKTFNDIPSLIKVLEELNDLAEGGELVPENDKGIVLEKAVLFREDGFLIVRIE